MEEKKEHSDSPPWYNRSFESIKLEFNKLKIFVEEHGNDFCLWTNTNLLRFADSVCTTTVIYINRYSNAFKHFRRHHPRRKPHRILRRCSPAAATR